MFPPPSLPNSLEDPIVSEALPTLGSASHGVTFSDKSGGTSHLEGTDSPSKARFIERQRAGAPWNFQTIPSGVTMLTIPWEFINNNNLSRLETDRL